MSYISTFLSSKIIFKGFIKKNLTIINTCKQNEIVSKIFRGFLIYKLNLTWLFFLIFISHSQKILT